LRPAGRIAPAGFFACAGGFLDDWRIWLQLADREDLLEIIS